MRVVGLISGGKDSVWNLHYCQHFGHEVVCVANLAPPPGVCELDSYMYQTVGSDLIDAIAQALGVPLVRRTIAGAPKAIASNSYTPLEGDEVEDLTLLLQDVLSAHPGVQAVSCGAILSNYQRLRVESVCTRLGLKVLAFMWRQEQELLLQQMINGGVDARIAKVASMGLEARHVGASILDARFASYVFSLGAKWGVHVCGEGGEYETTVVNAPMYQHGIELVGSKTVDHPDGGDGVAFLQVEKAVLGEAKGADSQGPPYAALEAYSSLQYYEQTFSQLRPEEEIAPAVEAAAVVVADGHRGDSTIVGSGTATLESATAISGENSAHPLLSPAPGTQVAPALVWVGGRIFASSSLDVQAFSLTDAFEASPAEQCDALLTAVVAWLRELHGDQGLENAAFVEVQVRDMGCFEAVNATYARFFGGSPPPRVCIETPLPPPLHLRLRLLLLRQKGGQATESSPDVLDDADVEFLRVQSISTWAMACIGPYSQALRIEQCLLSAGMLGLVPHSMTFPTSSDAVAAAAAMSAANSCDDIDATVEAVSAVSSSARTTPGMCTQWRVELWMLMRSLRNVLQVMNNGFGRVCLAQVYVKHGECCLDEARAAVLSYLQREAGDTAPIITCVEVPRLPKDGSIELNVLCAAGEMEHGVSRSSQQLHQGTGAVSFASLDAGGGGARIFVAEGSIEDGSSILGTEEELNADQRLAQLTGLCVSRTVKDFHCHGSCSELGDAKASIMEAAGISMQVQFAPSCAHRLVEASVRAALQQAGLDETCCAVSYMPVLSLGLNKRLRVICLQASS